MENMNITQARKNLFEIAERAIDYSSVINISTKKGNIILMSEEEYRGIMETMAIYSVPGLKEEIIEAANEPGMEIDWRKELE